MPIEYKDTSGDTGYNNFESVEPYANGEGANETTFRRPVEHLRHRTEVLRQDLDELAAVVSSDRGLTLLADSTTFVTWGGPLDGSPAGTGVFTLSPGKEVRVVPLTTPVAYYGGTWDKNDIWNRLTYVFNADKQFTAHSKLRISEGGNNLLLELFAISGQTFGGGAGVQVTVEGSKNSLGTFDPLAGPVLVRVQLSHNGSAITSPWSAVIAGISGATLPDTWLATAVTSGQESTVAVEIGRQYLWQGLGVAAGSQVAGCDSQAYRVTTAEIAAHFSVAANKLCKGDLLVVDFATAKDRLDQGGDVSVGALLVTVHRSEATEPPTTRSTSGSVNRMNCIPIAKVIDNELYFLNGMLFKKDVQAALASDNTLRGDLGDAEGGDSGDTLIGAAAKTVGSTTLAQGTVSSQMTALTTVVDITNEMRLLVNNHPKLEVHAYGGEAGTQEQISVRDSGALVKFAVLPDGEVGIGGNATDGRALTVTGDARVSGKIGIGGDAEASFAVKVTGDTKTTGNVIPSTTGSGHIGLTGARFATGWLNAAKVESLSHPDPGTVHYINVASSLLPTGATTDDKFLGDGSHHWNTVYGDKVCISTLYSETGVADGDIQVYTDLIANGTRKLGANGYSWSEVWGTTIQSTDIYATSVYTGSLRGNTGNITAYNTIVPSGTITLGTSGTPWEVNASHLHAIQVYATTSAHMEAQGGGVGGQLLVGAGDANGESAYVTYSGFITVDTTYGNDVAIVSHHAGISQAAWLKVLNGTTVYAVPLFKWAEVM
jgi:hypothetical protein